MSATYRCKCGRERFQDEPVCSFCIGAAFDALLAVLRDKVMPALQAVVAAVQEFDVKPDATVTAGDFCAAQATVNAAIEEAAMRQSYREMTGQDRGHLGFIRHGGMDYAVLFEERGFVKQIDSLHGRVCGDPLPPALVGQEVAAWLPKHGEGSKIFTVSVLDNRTVRSNGPYTLPKAVQA